MHGVELPGDPGSPQGWDEILSHIMRVQEIYSSSIVHLARGTRRLILVRPLCAW